MEPGVAGETTNVSDDTQLRAIIKEALLTGRPPSTPMPQGDEQVLVGDGHGQVVEMTPNEWDVESQRINEEYAASGGEGLPMVGLLPSGELGVIGICLPSESRTGLPEEYAAELPDNVDRNGIVPMSCGPAPGVEWPKSDPDWDWRTEIPPEMQDLVKEIEAEIEAEQAAGGD